MAIELSHTHTPHGHARLMAFGGAAIPPPFFLLGCRDLLAIAPGLGLGERLMAFAAWTIFAFCGQVPFEQPPLARVYLLFRSVRVSESIFSTKLIRDIFETMLEPVI